MIPKPAVQTPNDGSVVCSQNGYMIYNVITQIVDETWYTDVTSQDDDKKSNKKWGSPRSFSRHHADKYCYLRPFDKNCAQPKTETKRRDFFDDASR